MKVEIKAGSLITAGITKQTFLVVENCGNPGRLLQTLELSVPLPFLHLQLLAVNSDALQRADSFKRQLTLGGVHASDISEAYVFEDKDAEAVLIYKNIAEYKGFDLLLRSEITVVGECKLRDVLVHDFTLSSVKIY